MLTPSCFWKACARRSVPAQRGGMAEQLERCSGKRSRRGASASELAAGEASARLLILVRHLDGRRWSGN